MRKGVARSQAKAARASRLKNGLGWGDNGAGAGGTWGYWMPGQAGVTAPAANYICAVPADFSSGDKFGGFRKSNGFNDFDIRVCEGTNSSDDCGRWGDAF